MSRWAIDRKVLDGCLVVNLRVRADDQDSAQTLERASDSVDADNRTIRFSKPATPARAAGDPL